MPVILNIPSGPKNLTNLFPLVDFNQVDEYSLQVQGTNNDVILTTPTFKNVQCEDIIVLHYINYLGLLDSMPFKLLTGDNEIKSEVIKTHSDNRYTHFQNKTNIRSVVYYQAETILSEVESILMVELFNSPYVWIEYTGIQNQSDSYLPVVLVDKRNQFLKDTERFQYQHIIEFYMSHENSILRG